MEMPKEDDPEDEDDVKSVQTSKKDSKANGHIKLNSCKKKLEHEDSSDRTQATLENGGKSHENSNGIIAYSKEHDGKCYKKLFSSFFYVKTLM